MANSADFAVTVETHYLATQSDPSQSHYVFAYIITINNYGNEAAQLLRRHWVITDSTGHVEEVRGDGVVGEQPLIRPGEHYRYSSGSVLKTPVGSMYGSYEFVGASGAVFAVPIEPFSLNVPDLVH